MTWRFKQPGCREMHLAENLSCIYDDMRKNRQTLSAVFYQKPHEIHKNFWNWPRNDHGAFSPLDLHSSACSLAKTCLGSGILEELHHAGTYLGNMSPPVEYKPLETLSYSYSRICGLVLRTRFSMPLRHCGPPPKSEVRTFSCPLGSRLLDILDERNRGT